MVTADETDMASGVTVGDAERLLLSSGEDVLTLGATMGLAQRRNDEKRATTYAQVVGVGDS